VDGYWSQQRNLDPRNFEISKLRDDRCDIKLENGNSVKQPSERHDMAPELEHKKKQMLTAPMPAIPSAVQLIGTCLILAFIPGNQAKFLSFLAFWMATFGKLSRHEVVIAVIVNTLFTIMNVNAITHGIFAFTNPDIASLLPVWELVMWSFYVLHGRRTLGGSSQTDLKKPAAIICAIVYSAPFSAVSNQQWLFFITLVLLVLSLVIFHERMDFAYAGYFVLLGACIEYTGVWSGEWYYPSRPYTGVPVWFITMWGGVGLYVRRILG
jgi:hypothetical protein